MCSQSSKRREAGSARQGACGRGGASCFWKTGVGVPPLERVPRVWTAVGAGFRFGCRGQLTVGDAPLSQGDALRVAAAEAGEHSRWT